LLSDHPTDRFIDMRNKGKRRKMTRRKKQKWVIDDLLVELMEVHFRWALINVRFSLTNVMLMWICLTHHLTPFAIHERKWHPKKKVSEVFFSASLEREEERRRRRKTNETKQNEKEEDFLDEMTAKAATGIAQKLARLEFNSNEKKKKKKKNRITVFQRRIKQKKKKKKVSKWEQTKKKKKKNVLCLFLLC